MRPLSGRSYIGQSGCSKNRDQKVREKISGVGFWAGEWQKAILLAEPGDRLMGYKTLLEKEANQSILRFNSVGSQ
ncbi:hypothetical protein TNCV_5048621 [Trichonephila clavipes]|nr:hypothetical protein TNCV_5048621 [Trichonephila clavipes]